MKLTVLQADLVIARLDGADPLPDWALATIRPGGTTGFLSITRTDQELTIVCDAALVREDFTDLGGKVEGGWRALRVRGPLEFSMTGVITGLTAPLAQAGISVFVVSTFDTDYVLVRSGRLVDAVDVLSKAGHEVAASEPRGAEAGVRSD